MGETGKTGEFYALRNVDIGKGRVKPGDLLVIQDAGLAKRLLAAGCISREPPAEERPAAAGEPAGLSDQQLERLRGFMEPLDIERDGQHFTMNGLPSIEACSKALGAAVTEGERDAAWAEVLEARPLTGEAYDEAVLDAIGRLDPAKPGDYTQAGKPNSDMLAALVGQPVSGADRDRLFRAWEERQAGGGDQR